MSDVKIYYHDPVEVSPNTSWVGLSDILKKAQLVDIKKTSNPKVISLFDYARPDAVITVDDIPILSIEQTQMNPSGHNIPQRFSSQVRAAELGVSSILYYPEYSRRTFSDPNVRYLQVRVPMAQIRLSAIYQIPALSIFWPTKKKTNLPETKPIAHQELADVITVFVNNPNQGKKLLRFPQITSIFSRMESAINKYSKTSRYRENKSVRTFLTDGFSSSKISENLSIDPPTKSSLIKTSDLFSKITPPLKDTQKYLDMIKSRKLSLVFNATTNKSGFESEHPWPGYLTLLDILYTRKTGGKKKSERDVNLIYQIPITPDVFLKRLNQNKPPTATYIVDSFADVIIVNGKFIPGIPIRGYTKASFLN
jgi:hypothetical protein